MNLVDASGAVIDTVEQQTKKMDWIFTVLQ